MNQEIQKIIDNFKSIIWMNDLNGRCTYLNPEIVDVLSGDFTSILTEGWTHFVHEEDRRQFLRIAVDAKRNHEEYQFEYRLKRSDGSFRWVLDSAAPRFDASGNFAGYIGSIVDISSHKDAIDSVAKSEAQYRLLAENSSDLISHLDPEGRYIYASPSYLPVLGYSPGEIQGLDVYTHLHSDDHGIIREEIDRQLDGYAVSQILEIRKRRKSGGYEWFSLKVTVLIDPGTRTKLGTIAVCRSIHAQKLAQDALKAHALRLENWAKVSTDLIWEVDLEENTVWRSAQAEKIFGLPSNTCLSTDTDWSDHIHPEDRLRVLRGFKAIYAGKIDQWQDEYRLRLPNGSYAHVLDKAASIRDSNGRTTAIVGSFIDLTLQKKTEFELARLNRLLNLRSACSKLLSRTEREEELQEGICNLAREISGYRMAWIGFAEDDPEKTLRIAACASDPSDRSAILKFRVSWDESAAGGIGRGPSGRAIRTNEPQFIEDVSQDPTLKPWHPILTEHKLKGAISLPLKTDGKAFGVLVLYAHERLKLSQEEIQLLLSLADELSFGIVHLRSKAEKSRMQLAVASVATGVSASADESFFEHLAMHMADAMGADGAFIASFPKEDSGYGHVIAAVVGGKKSNKFRYELDGTPCATLFSTPLCIVTERLIESFPKASHLPPLGLQACVGSRLENDSGEIIGAVFVLYRRKILDTEIITSSLKIFGTRVAAELDRMKNIKKIREQASLLDKAKDAIVVHDIDGRVLFWNKGAEKLYGWRADEIIGRNASALQSSQDEFEFAIAKVLTDGQWSGELENLTKNGGILPIRAEWTLVKDVAGRPQSIFSINTDITQSRDDQRKIKRLAYYDQLTGLPNRQMLMERLENLIAGDAHAKRPAALFFIDLDNFKSLNDTLGHDIGDQLLTQVANRLTDCVRRTDFVARLGGDEFVVMLTDLSVLHSEAERAARSLAESIRKYLSQPYKIGIYEHQASLSIGIAMFSHEPLTISEALKRADMAMYKAKELGKNRICFFDPVIEQQMTERTQLESDLRLALKNGQFFLEYQPQVHSRDGVIGMEGLIRWQHPGKGLIPPAKFIPFSEEAGIIAEIGMWVIETACRQIASWSKDPILGKAVVAVNVSARQVRDPGFVDDVMNALIRTGASPTKLKLELTESMLVENIDETIQKMHRLCEVGVSFALDDFGTGFSSLSYLKRLPINTLKIDRSFVKDILTNSNDSTIARAIVALAHNLNLDVIAEGVETEAVRMMLATFGCDCYQGYLYSKPLLPAAVEHWVHLGIHALLPTESRARSAASRSFRSID